MYTYIEQLLPDKILEQFVAHGNFAAHRGMLFFCEFERNIVFTIFHQNSRHQCDSPSANGDIVRAFFRGSRGGTCPNPSPLLPTRFVFPPPPLQMICPIQFFYQLFKKKNQFYMTCIKYLYVFGFCPTVNDSQTLQPYAPRSQL